MTRDWVLSVLSKGTRDGEYRICCPYCDDESFHMYCNLSKMLYHCFKCEAKGRIQMGMKPFDSLDKFEEMVHKVRFKPKTVTVPIAIKENWVRTLPLSKPLGSLALDGDALQYLIDRGVPTEQRDRYCRVSIEESGPYKDTIIFPIYEPHTGHVAVPDRLKYFVARRYTDKQPKYINAPWPKDDTLFIVDGRGNRCADLNAVIVEGIFDALAVARAGYCAYALLGKRATGQQLIRIANISKKGPHPFIIYLDDDALSHAIHLKMELETLGIPTVIFHHRLDAAALAVEDMEELRRQLNAASEHLRDKEQ